MATRREFLTAGALTGAGFLLPWRFGTRHGWADVPGGTLAPSSILKYVTPLVIPPAMPRPGRSKHSSFDYYEIAVRQFQQHILPPAMGLPPTTVWSYGSTAFPGTAAQGGSFN